jgi:hypothetical protein
LGRVVINPATVSIRVIIFRLFPTSDYGFVIKRKDRKPETANIAIMMKLMIVFFIFRVAIKMIVMML